MGSSASPGQKVTETRGGVLKLSKVGLGTLEATERQLQHPGADHGAGGRHHHCLLSTGATEADPAVAQVCRGEEGERDGRAAPRRKKPRWGSCFLKNLCFVCIF